MAVSSAQVNELRERQKALRKELEDAYEKLETERERLENENYARLESLSEQSGEMLAEREEKLRAEYSKMLDAGLSAQESVLSENLRALRERYDKVCAEVNEAVTLERRRTEAVMLEQRKFEEAYLLKKELARDTAEKAASEAEQAYDKLSAAPLEWFRRGRLSIYRTQLSEIKRLLGMELFESAAAVSDNFLLSVRLELLECESALRRWLRYYRILTSALEDERRLVYEKALTVPEELEKFRAANSGSIAGGKMSAELAGYWTNGEYERLREQYRNDFAALDRFRRNGGQLITDEDEIKELMLKFPDEGVRFSETALYRRLSGVLDSIERAQGTLDIMSGRMNAFEQRLILAGETIQALADEQGYTLCDIPPFGGEGEAGSFTMTFSDRNNVHTADVMIVPVRRYSDGAWINHAVWFYSEGTGERTVNALEGSLAGVFVRERRISLRRDVMRTGQTRAERVELARGEMQLMQNLRTN